MDLYYKYPKRRSIHKLILFSMFSLLASVPLHGQFKNLGYYGNDTAQCNTPDPEHSGNSVQLVNLVSYMCIRLGLANRFTLYPCTNISGVKSALINGDPLIYYNPDFVRKIEHLRFDFTNQNSNADWRILAVLAHEIGHYFNFHFVEKPRIGDQGMVLEADGFSGEMLYMLGATLEQAQNPLYDPSIPDADMEHYPGRKKRLKAVAEGYNMGKLLFPMNDQSKTPPLISLEDAKVLTELRQADELFAKDADSQAFEILSRHKGSSLMTPKQYSQLGYFYLRGKVTPKNYAEAFKWSKIAADQDDATAMNNLGYMYQHGYGVSQDLQKAAGYYEAAVEKNDANAQVNLSGFYLSGTVVRKNEKKAFELAKRSALQNYAGGQNQLAFLYEMGIGVKKNYLEALYWFKKSAEQNDSEGQVGLGIMFFNGRGVEQDYYEARRLFEKSAAQENGNGQANLGLIHYYGVGGVKRDFAEAISWFKKAADQNNGQGLYFMGKMYEYGYGVPQNAKIAEQLYEKASLVDWSVKQRVESEK